MTVATLPASDWTLEQVLSLDTQAQVQLFSSLSPPDFETMQGEYLGHATRPRSVKAEARQRASLFDETSPFGFWLGKAFTAVNTTQGEGYNHCRKEGGQVVRHLRFGTHLGTSYLDGKPAFLLTYSSFNNRSGAEDLTDELRVLASNLYLGVATTRLPDGSRSRPTLFLLSGPVGRFVGPDRPERERW